jgi:predicted Zn-dependent protease
MNTSPLSVSPVGEMLVTPLRQRLGDAGYSASAEIGRCRLLRFGRDWEMQATPLRQRLGDAGYSALAEIERCRNRCSATDSPQKREAKSNKTTIKKKTG